MSEIQSENQSLTTTTTTQGVETVELKNEDVKAVVERVIAEYQFRGPIPPPDTMSGYERTLPGAADRILAMAEKQAEHRQLMESKMIEAESRDSLLGVISGFTLGIGCVIAAIIMAVVYPASAGVISGAVLGSTGVASIAATAIKSTRRARRSNDENN